jgi:hypothetical protein
MFLLIVCQYFVLQVLESANRNKLCCKRNKWTWKKIKKSTYGTNIVRNKCSTKSLSKLLTCILLTVKPGLQSYCDTSYSRGGVNQMWILKNSKDLLEYIQSRSLSSCNSIKTFDFSTLYTNILHSKLKDKLKELVQLCFIKKNGQRRYKYLVLGRDRSYFVKHHSDSYKRFSETDIFNMLEFLIDNIFCYVWWTCFSTDSRHTYGCNLCSSSRRLVPLFVWGRLHTGASQEKRKEASPILLFHVPLYRW